MESPGDHQVECEVEVAFEAHDDPLGQASDVLDPAALELARGGETAFSREGLWIRIFSSGAPRTRARSAST
jgi:hypothetical protein